MIKRQGTDGGTRGALASIIGGNGGRSASVLVLLCIKKLHDAHLEPVDLALDGETKPHEVSRKIVDMLRDQEFFSGPSEQALLTSKGHKSIRTASANDDSVAQFLGLGHSVLKHHDPSEILLSILRVHFNLWPS